MGLENALSAQKVYTETHLTGPAFKPPSPLPDICIRFADSFKNYSDVEVFRLTGKPVRSEDYQFKAVKNGETVSRVNLIRDVTTTGEIIFDLQVAQLFRVGQQGVATVCTLAVLHQAKSLLLTDLGITPVKITFNDMHNIGWKTLRAFYPLAKGQVLQIASGKYMIYQHYFVLK